MAAIVRRDNTKNSRPYYVQTNVNGKRPKRYFGQNKDAAQRFATEVNLSLAEHTFQIRSTDANQTLAECAAKFLAQHTEVKESSIENIQKNLDNHVLPLLGHKPIAELTDDDVLLLITTCKAKHLKTNTIHGNIFPALSGVLSWAVEKKYLPKNPCTKMGKKCINADEIKKEVVPLTKDEAARLLEAAAQVLRFDYWVMILLLLRTGLRLGEMIALQWDAIDLVHRIIRVKRNMSKNKLSSPKKKQNRTVGISLQLAEALRTHKVNEEAKAKRAGRTELYDWVFNTEGEWIRTTTFRRDNFHKAIKAAGLPKRVTPHWLRHTFVSRLLTGDPYATPPIPPVPIATVSRLVGHNSINVTVNTYGHLMPQRDHAMVDALDDVRTVVPMHPPRTLGHRVESVND